ncbi:hypothetical protein ACWCXB_32650 [Streptomyces sp. NPDC001514]
MAAAVAERVAEAAGRARETWTGWPSAYGLGAQDPGRLVEVWEAGMPSGSAWRP